MLVLSFSGNAENSLTLKSLEVLEHHPDVTDEFEKVLVKPSAKMDDGEWFAGLRAKMEAADIIIWAASPYHMNIPSHMLRFFEKCRSEGVKLGNVNTFFQTNVRVCDNFLSDNLERNIRSIAPHFVQGLSYGSYDMINKEMQLYLISVPDRPEGIKKGLFKKGEGAPPEFKDGEGIKNAVAWYRMLKAYKEYFVGGKAEFPTAKSKKALFIDTFGNAGEITGSLAENVKKLRSVYSAHGVTVTDIALRDMNVRPCDGCKLCYASKQCKIKDDFGKYEALFLESDIIIFIGKCEFGYMGSLLKRFTDRFVKKGLMPTRGVHPRDLKSYHSLGLLADCSDGVSFGAMREYQFALSSFDIEHCLGMCTDGMTLSPTAEEMGIYSLMLYEYGLIPQRNFFSEKIGRHFSDLSQSIPTVIPDEAKYYRKCGAYDPVPVETNARPAMPDTYKIGAKMRLIPYEKVIESLDRRKNKP